MSVIRFAEIHDGRGGSSGGSDDTDSNRHWRVVTDNKYDDDADVLLYGLSNGLLPNLYQPHPSNGYLTARRIRAENQSDSPFHWIVTAEYSSKPISEKEKDKEQFDNPTERPATVGPWQTAMYSVPVEADLEGDAVVNSAGDYFDPPPEVDKPLWSCKVSKAVASVPEWVADLEAPINDGDYSLGGLTIKDGCGRVMSISISDKQEENGFSFYKFECEIQIRKKRKGTHANVSPWQLLLLDQGLRRKATNFDEDPDGDRVHIELPNEDGDFSKVTSPVLLDGEGMMLVNPSPTTAVYLPFTVIDKIDFNDLPLT